MPIVQPASSRRALARRALAFIVSCCGLGLATPPIAAQDAAAAASAPGSGAALGAAGLRARFDALKEPLAHNPYGRPIVIESTQSSDYVQGDVIARVDQPYANLAQALQGTGNWCAILILHLNTKMCHPLPNGLDMALGRKYDQPVDQAYKLHFDYKLDVAGPDYLRAGLSSADGPIGTRDYRILVEVEPLDAARSILHLSYAYGFGFTARTAMGLYLSTTGADKVGFTVTGQDADGHPEYIGGMRGLTERNTMRYYMAILAFVADPAPGRLDHRLESWFDDTERYPRQLHEVDKTTYLTMKHVEAQR